MAAMLWVLYFLYVYRSALQGLGDTLMPMVSGMAEFVMRISAALIFPHFIRTGWYFLCRDCSMERSHCNLMYQLLCADA